MRKFFEVYERYRKRYNLKAIIQTSIYGYNRIRIWQEKSISENNMIMDVFASNEEELSVIATDQLVRYFEIFN